MKLYCKMRISAKCYLPKSCIVQCKMTKNSFQLPVSKHQIETIDLYQKAYLLVFNERLRPLLSLGRPHNNGNVLESFVAITCFMPICNMVIDADKNLCGKMKNGTKLIPPTIHFVLPLALS